MVQELHTVLVQVPHSKVLEQVHMVLEQEHMVLVQEHMVLELGHSMLAQAFRSSFVVLCEQLYVLRAWREGARRVRRYIRHSFRRSRFRHRLVVALGKLVGMVQVLVRLCRRRQRSFRHIACA